MRLFIAITFDSETKEKIVNIQSRLKQCTKGNFTSYNNLHLTLEFLGELSQAQAERIKSVMKTISVSEITLHLNKVGCFKKRGGDIYWIGVEHNPTLLAMQKQLHSALLSEDFTLENRPYRPHITLARKVKIINDFNGQNLMRETITVHADKISLMISTREDNKLVYKELYSV